MRLFLAIICFWAIAQLHLHAQGPPITSDKPIMLGAKRTIIKTLSEIRNTEQGTFSRLPLIVHYLPTSNTLKGIHLPVINLQFMEEGNDENGWGLGDIQILAKYQFYRKDQTGKTFRMVAKTLQTLPTGKTVGLTDVSTGIYQSYFGIVAAKESLQYGISSELGYNIVAGKENSDELRAKLGFGLPLKKQTYPVNQINLFFEYNSNWKINGDFFELLYAQGVQYAKGQLTIETALQFPLIQTVAANQKRNVSLFLGSRFVF